MTTVERFLQYVAPEPNTGCWLWTGTGNQDGYGMFHLREIRAMRSAHRVAYAMYRGEIPEGLEVDHLCRVRCCVNPDHLEAVSHWENSRRQCRACDREKKRAKANKGMSEKRDPRVDPKAGDVLRKLYGGRHAESHGYLQRTVHQIGYHKPTDVYYEKNVSCAGVCAIKAWREWAKGAEVIHAAE